jgi:hypothetical protein
MRAIQSRSRNKKPVGAVLTAILFGGSTKDQSAPIQDALPFDGRRIARHRFFEHYPAATLPK